MDKSYRGKHWLLTLLIGPLLPYFFGLIYLPLQERGSLETYPLFVMFGIVFSLPVLGLYCIVFKILNDRNNLPIILNKTILNLTVIIGVFITFQVIKGTIAIPMSMGYSVAAMLSSFFIKLHQKESI
ncbi:MAG: hypothetical protein JWP88_1823 [Flaviaesturariibacter sp.]|nr:hypothetical protein [Flaviaesturariibacter sp.]